MDIISYIVFGVIIGILITIYILKLFRHRTLTRRIQKAKKSEYKAIQFIESQGFEVLDIQKDRTYTLFIDDKPHDVTVRADMIVRKGNKIYVAEVKTGEKVTSPKYRETRRQLLEYFFVYQPNGLLLIDMEKRKIKTVVYSFLKCDKTAYIKRLVFSLSLIVIGFIIGFLTRGG